MLFTGAICSLFSYRVGGDWLEECKSDGQEGRLWLVTVNVGSELNIEAFREGEGKTRYILLVSSLAFGCNTHY